MKTVGDFDEEFTFSRLLLKRGSSVRTSHNSPHLLALPPGPEGDALAEVLAVAALVVAGTRELAAVVQGLVDGVVAELDGGPHHAHAGDHGASLLLVAELGEIGEQKRVKAYRIHYTD